MTSSVFSSVLFLDGDAAALEHEAPGYFRDLNLDQAVRSMTAGREAYELDTFFHTRLRSVDAVRYRHEVFTDLAREDVLAHIRAFAGGMTEVRRLFARMEAARYRYASQAWYLEAAWTYCGAVRRLVEDLGGDDLRSRGLRDLCEYLAAYVGSDGLQALVADAQRVREDLAAVRYSVNIRGPRVIVGRYEGEADFTAEVERTFERFRQGAVKDYAVDVRRSADMDHVEGQVLELVAKLHPRQFEALERFCERHEGFVDDTVRRLDREIQFYVACIEQAERLRRAGLSVCLPEVSDDSKEIHARETFDIALANALASERREVVTNDFHLRSQERIIVVSGPNNGGKTTFARMFGQLHHLAALGGPVPGTEATLFVCDELFTHFEREEVVTSLSGKLEDDLVRTHDILERATRDSVVVMNETFTSTTLRDALLLGTAVMEQLIELDVLGVYVTFVDELASLSEATVSMVSTIVPEDPATRTFRLERRPADGLAYAAAIAEKYGLTYERLKERMAA